MKFLQQGKRISLLAKLFFGFFAISVAAFAAQEFFNTTIQCMSSQNYQDCQYVTGEQPSTNLKKLAFELSSVSQNPELCAIETQNYTVTGCTINGQSLSCTGYPGDGASCDTPDGLLTVSCGSVCSISIDLNKCSSGSNTQICSGLLPETVCQQNPGLCSTGVQSTATVFQGAISSLCTDNPNSELCSLINSTDGQEIIQALTPENLDLANDASITAQAQLFSFISQHLQGLRQGTAVSTSTANNHYYFNDQHQAFSPEQLWAATSNIQNDAISDELENVISLSQDGRLSMYVNASYLRARQDLSALEGKSKSYIAMLTTGLDYRLSQGVVGGALSLSDGNTEYGRNDSEFDSQNYTATVYGSFYKKQWWLDGAVSYGVNRFNQERDIFCSAASCTSINNIYDASYNGSTFGGQIASGYDFIFGGFSVSPFAQWQVGSIKTDAYKEKARFTGITATIAIDEQDRDFSTASLGSYLRYSIATKKAVLIPYLRVLFNHELKDDAQYISGRLVGAANSDFLVRANDRDNNYATIGTGLSFQMQNGNSGFIDIESVEAYDKLSQYQLSGGWRFVF